MQGLLLAAILIILLLCGCSINGQNVIPGEITGRVYLDEDADSQCDECGCDFFLEGIIIQLYEGNCGGVIQQTTQTDPEGTFIFTGLIPGEYCVYPKVKTICEGYKPTTPIQQNVRVISGESAEIPWFGFDYNLDVNNYLFSMTIK